MSSAQQSIHILSCNICFCITETILIMNFVIMGHNKQKKREANDPIKMVLRTLNEGFYCSSLVNVTQKTTINSCLPSCFYDINILTSILNFL